MGSAPNGAKPNSGMEPILSMMPIILIVVIFYFFIIRPQMKEQKKHQKMLSELKKGDKVLTTGGIYGVVVGISDKDNVIVIRIDENTKVEVAKSYVIGVKREGQETVISGNK
jgi:preprotein translocase subunit YajC